MRREDISQVAEIDHEAFPTLWPPMNYQRELQNVLAHYLVACDERRQYKPAVRTPRGLSAVTARVRRWFRPGDLPADETPATPLQYVVGFTGTWIVAGEAHIINIAVRELYRHQGVGELLLISTIDMTLRLNAHTLMLEVRVSNTGAQALYRKYGFEQVGLRRGYYVDNKEDAMLMTAADIGSASYRRRLEQLRQTNSEKLE